MRILILSNFGMGLYKFRSELIKELLQQGHRVHLSLPQDEYTDKLVELGCDYTQVNIDRRGTNPIKDLKLLFHYLSLMRKCKADLVLTYTIKPNIYGGIASRLRKIPYLSNITGLGSAFENKGILERLTRQLYSIGLRKAQCVFFQNEVNRLRFIKDKLVKGKTRLIPGSGVNLAEHCLEDYPPQEEAIRLLFIGRIMKEKGIDELFQAAEQVKNIYPFVQFELIGFEEDCYSKQLHEYEVRGIIHYYGTQEEVHSYLKRAHALLLPSYHEGMANVLLEAAATGRPVLATRIPGCIETFEEGSSGMGFEPQDVESMVKVILDFIELPYEKKLAMGLAGRRKMEQEFDRNYVVDAYMEEINQVTSGYVTS